VAREVLFFWKLGASFQANMLNMRKFASDIIQLKCTCSAVASAGHKVAIHRQTLQISDGCSHHFNFVPKFPQHEGFRPQILNFLDKHFEKKED